MIVTTRSGGNLRTNGEVRTATVGDATQLAGLSNQFGYPASVRDVEIRLQMMEALPEHRVLVASLEDGAVVGWIHVYIAMRVESNPFGELGGFVVAEDHRRRGIGHSLLGAAETWLTGRGIQILRVRSRSNRIDAHAFFEQAGFSMTKDQRVFDKRIMIDI